MFESVSLSKPLFLPTKHFLPHSSSFPLEISSIQLVYSIFFHTTGIFTFAAHSCKKDHASSVIQFFTITFKLCTKSRCFSVVLATEKYILNSLPNNVKSAVKVMPHIMISSTMDFNVAKIASSASIITNSSTVSLRLWVSNFYASLETHIFDLGYPP